jgi:hypothetical protein
MIDKSKNVASPEVIEIPQIEMHTFSLSILGTTPLYMHRQSFKSRQELLYPSGDKTKGEKRTTLKHEPMEEYRSSFYLNRDDTRTRFHFPAGAFADAISGVATDIPGKVTKAQMQRLTNTVGVHVPIYGKPDLAVDMVRQSGMTRAPDVRIRPKFREWACQITLRFYALTLNPAQITNLVYAAGQLRGIGDWRPEKGGQFGTFTVVDEDDPTFQRIVREQGYDVQCAAYDNPEYFDDETRELIEWFDLEREIRAGAVNKAKPPVLDKHTFPPAVAAVAAKNKAKRNGAGATAS